MGTKYLRIANDGMIELAALHLMGASTKVGNVTQIGQYGSGNKYGVVFLVRNDIPPVIMSGMEQIKISTERQNFRDQAFDILCFNGERTSITTQMGKDWVLWQALREIICNAMDEGGFKVSVTDKVVAEEGVTAFHIPFTDQVKEFYDNWEHYFYSDYRVMEVLGEDKNVVLSKSSVEANIYRRGVRCLDTDLKSANDYDLTQIMIGEDRIASSRYQVTREIIKTMAMSSKRLSVSKFLDALSNEDMIEGQDPLSSFTISHHSVVFLDELRKRKWVPHRDAARMRDTAAYMVVNNATYDTIEPLLEDANKGPLDKATERPYEEVEMTKLQSATLDAAKDFMDRCGIEVGYNVRCVRFSNSMVMGAAHNNEILLSVDYMDRGLQELVNTIIEEYIHLKYKVKDETREFQYAVINELITYMKKVNSVII
jgi:hypothetical protein